MEVRGEARLVVAKINGRDMKSFSLLEESLDSATIGKLQMTAGVGLLRWSHLALLDQSEPRFKANTERDFTHWWRINVDQTFGRLICWIAFSARIQEKMESLEQKLDSLSEEQAEGLGPELDRPLNHAKPNLDEIASFVVSSRSSRCVASDDARFKGN